MPVRSSVQPHCHRATGRRVLDGIVKQVEKELTQAVRVALDLDGIREVDLQIDSFFPRCDIHVFCDLAHQVVESNRSELARTGARVFTAKK